MKRKPRSELKGITHFLMTRAELTQAVKAICEKLGESLPPEEIANGWTEQHRIHYLQFFQKLESDLHNRIELPYMPIGRWLDHSGIGEGEIAEDAYKISVALNNRKW